MASTASKTTSTTEAPHRAGAFDIRTFIALLIGVYGLVLVVAGLVGTSETELDRADGLNINLIAGIGMVVVAVAFVAWARMRPVVVPEHVEGDAPGAAESGKTSTKT
jgi:hypothetical protein